MDQVIENISQMYSRSSSLIELYYGPEYYFSNAIPITTSNINILGQQNKSYIFVGAKNIVCTIQNKINHLTVTHCTGTVFILQGAVSGIDVMFSQDLIFES